MIAKAYRDPTCTMSSAAGNIKLKAIFGLGPIPIGTQPSRGDSNAVDAMVTWWNLAPRLLQKCVIPAADLPACHLSQTQAIPLMATNG